MCGLVKRFWSSSKKLSTVGTKFFSYDVFFFSRQCLLIFLARPPPAALSYLVDLVAQIQQSGGRGDPRTDEQIANELGESSIFLMALKDVTPQQTALNVFNQLYPKYEAKVELDSINNLQKLKPGLLETILGIGLIIEISI